MFLGSGIAVLAAVVLMQGCKHSSVNEATFKPDNRISLSDNVQDSRLPIHLAISKLIENELYVEATELLQTSSVECEVYLALQRNDSRWLAVQEIVLQLPGVEKTGQLDESQVYVIPGTSDHLANDAQVGWHEQARDYATRYNVVLSQFQLTKSVTAIQPNLD